MEKGRRQRKLIRFITTPIRILGKARDLYVKSIMSCADGGNYGYAVGYHGVDSVAFPRSFSVGSRQSSDGDDFKELMKATSCKIGSKNLPKSCSVQMGRIDEDKACEFGDDGGVPRAAYPRSKSCAVAGGVGR